MMDKENYDEVTILTSNGEQYISYYLGYRCNLDCKYCHLDKGFDNSRKSNGIENLDKVIEYQKTLGRNLGKILLSGGEPTLFREEVLEILKKYSGEYKITIISNGVKKDVLKEFCEYPVEIIISYDGHINDRGFDSFETIRMVDSLNRLTGVNLVISNANYPYLFDTLSELVNEFPSLLTDRNLEHRLSGLNIEMVRHKKDFYEFDFEVFRTQIRKVYTELTHLLHIFSTRDYVCENFWELDVDLICSHENGELKGRGCYEGLKDLDKCLDLYANNCEVCDVRVCYVRGCPCAADLIEVDKNEHPYCICNRIIQEEVFNYRKSEFLKKQLESSKYVELILTDNCNMNCTHCFQKGCHSNNVMSAEVVDSVFRNIINKKDLTYTINLFGGEPIMGSTLSIRKHLYEKLKKETDKNVIVTMVSNLFSISDEDIQWLKDMKTVTKGLYLQVSLDSVEKFNDIPRVDKAGKGTFKKVLENLKKVSAIIGKEFININSVITDENIGGLKDWCEFLTNEIYEKYVWAVSFRTDQTRNTKMTVKEKVNLSKALSDVFDSYNKGLINNQIVKSLFNLKKSIYDDELTKTKDQHSSCGVCNETIVVEPNGNLTPCHTFDSKVEGDYKVGNIIDLSYGENIEDIYKELGSVDDQYSEYAQKKCNECEFKIECVRCKVEHLRHNKDVTKVLYYACEFVHQRAKSFRKSGLFQRFKPFSEEEKVQLRQDILELSEIYDETKDKEALYTIDCLETIVEEKRWYK